MGHPASLRFRAKGTALVPNYEFEAAGIRAFVGRKFVPVEGEPGRYGFAPLAEDVEVPYRAEYVKACKEGDLYPADEATAKACGAKFDPLFGGDAEEKS